MKLLVNVELEVRYGTSFGRRRPYANVRPERWPLSHVLEDIVGWDRNFIDDFIADIDSDPIAQSPWFDDIVGVSFGGDGSLCHGLLNWQ